MRGYTGGVHTKRELPGCPGACARGNREIPDFSTFGIGPAAAGQASDFQAFGTLEAQSDGMNAEAILN